MTVVLDELRWVAEPVPARWDENKAALLGAEPVGMFRTSGRDFVPGQLVGGNWYRVETLAGDVVAYGWMDISWGDAEILIATRADMRAQGVGTYVLEHLKHEAHCLGQNYLTNVVAETHPAREQVVAWLQKRGFVAGADGRLFRGVSFQTSVEIELPLMAE